MARALYGRYHVKRFVSHEDWLPTFAAAAGNKSIKEQLLKGVTLNGKNYKNYIDGYDLNDYLSGKAKVSPRSEFWYVNDDGQVVAARYDDWKITFMENRGQQFGVWLEPFTELRVPLIFNLRRDPFEKSQHNSNTYYDWVLSRVYVIVPVQQLAAKFLLTMKDFPPSQTPGSFNLSGIEAKLKNAVGN